VTYAPTATCNARTRGGNLCALPAGWATGHAGYGRCKLHGGASRSGEIAAARHAAVALATEAQIEPADGLLWAVWLSAAEVQVFSQRVAELADEEILVEHDRRGAELNPWLRARADATERLARYSKMALDAGVEERHVRLAEEWHGLMASAFSLLLDRLELDSRQLQAAPGAVRAALELLEGGPPVEAPRRLEAGAAR
jgi:hypothetical protein